MRRMPLRVSFSASCSTAVLICVLVQGRLEGQLVNLGDIVGGGDGSGNAPAANVGINADTGVFETVHVNANIVNTGDNPQTVLDPGMAAFPLIDSVFIIDSTPIAINSELVPFNFEPGDTAGNTWNHILSDLTHDVDKGINEVRAGGERLVHGDRHPRSRRDHLQPGGDPRGLPRFGEVFHRVRGLGRLRQHERQSLCDLQR